LHIEEDHVGGQLEDFLHCGRAVLTFPYDFNILEFSQSQHNATASQGFIVND
jgi:hypothetical protein